ncbi:MAG: transposase [Planctomycetota bacterium]
MPRLLRCDRPGRWFHVFNRGIARRPVFETRADVRFFLACLARAVRRGEIEIHAYCILTTHFHLLVRSPSGSLAVAMDRVLNAYVRYYNRRRRRDGSLFRGRYGARPVDSLVYRRIVVRYIDRNAVQAGLARLPWEFPYGSAWHYVQPRRPQWLETQWVDREVVAEVSTEPWEGYGAVFGREWTRCDQALVDGRMRAPVNRDEPLDHLIEAAPPAVLAWMRRKAILADGRVPSLPVVDGRTIHRVLEAERQEKPSWTYQTGKGQSREAWPTAEAYLLRHLAAMGWVEIGKRLDVGPDMAAKRVRQGQTLLGVDAAYAEKMALLTRQVLDRAHGARR